MQHVHRTHYLDALQLLGNALVSALSLDEIERVLRAALPRLDIDFFCVCAFDADPRNARIVAMSAGAGQAEPRDQSPFPAKDLLPGRLRERSSTLDLSVHPLRFADRRLGYLVLDQPRQPDHGWINHGIAAHLSSALYLIEQRHSLKVAQEAAERGNLAKSRFISSMSHEIRTPIAAILGYLDLAESTAATPQQAQHIGLARIASRTLLSLVNDILDWSKIEADQLKLDHTRFSLDGLLDELVGTYGIMASEKGIDLVVDVSPDVPPHLVGDPLRLGQVLANLVGNAIKFTELGRVVVRVEPAAGPGDPAHLRFSVKDSGIGIDIVQVRSIMQPFFQGERSARRYGGTGLGLAISRRLVELMGGQLQVVSAPEQGSTFYFDAKLECARMEAVRARQLAGLRLLVVDSDPAEREAIMNFMAAEGCSGDVLPTEAAALAVLTKGEYDAAVLAQRSGADLEVLRARLIERAVPAIVLCDLHALNRSLALDQREGLTVIPRPFQRGALRECLRKGMRETRPASSRPPPLDLTGPDARSLAGRRLLLVEDNRLKRGVVSALLEAIGVAVEIATTGTAAVQRASVGRYDLILMDLELPEMDGLQATRIIRNVDPLVPIVAFSASMSEDELELCREVGMNDWLATPCEPAELYATIARSIGSAELRIQSKIDSSAATGTGAGQWRVLSDELGMLRLGGSLSLYRHLLSEIVEEYAHAPAEIERALVNGDVSLARELVHGLSSSLGMAGAEQVHALARAFESAFVASDLTSCRKHLLELSTALPRALAAMQAWLAVDRAPESP